MAWKGFATVATLAALLVSGCGGGRSGSSTPTEVPGVEAASRSDRRDPETNARPASSARSAPVARPTASASSKSRAQSKPRGHEDKRPKAAVTPEAASPHRSHPEIERLLESNDSGGQGAAVGTGGTEATPHQAEKILRRLKEEAREDARGHGNKEGAVEEILGQLTGG